MELCTMKSIALTEDEVIDALMSYVSSYKDDGKYLSLSPEDVTSIAYVEHSDKLKKMHIYLKDLNVTPIQDT